MRSSTLVGAVFFAIVNAAPAAQPEPVRTVYNVVDVYTTVYEIAKPTATRTAVRQAQAQVVRPSSSAVAPVAASPAPVSVKAAAAPQAASTGFGNFNGDKYAQRVLDHHNVHRANHSSPDLTWDANLANIAYQIANSCSYGHDTKTGGGGYGQNIAAGAPIENITATITNLFYNFEMANFNGLYGQATPSNMNDHSKFNAYGHFTQLVWKSTTKVGCASVDCKGRGKGPNGLANVGVAVSPIFTVCNYSPPGNYIGEFAKNVLPPLGHAAVGWDYKL